MDQTEAGAGTGAEDATCDEHHGGGGGVDRREDDIDDWGQGDEDASGIDLAAVAPATTVTS